MPHRLVSLDKVSYHTCNSGWSIFRPQTPMPSGALVLKMFGIGNPEGICSPEKTWYCNEMKCQFYWISYLEWFFNVAFRYFAKSFFKIFKSFFFDLISEKYFANCRLFWPKKCIIVWLACLCSKLWISFLSVLYVDFDYFALPSWFPFLHKKVTLNLVYWCKCHHLQ